MITAMDRIDRDILRVLESDGRMRWGELAARVHLSPNAVAERVRRLQRSGVIAGFSVRRDWATLGPKLRGKLHIYVGEMDNYYLNNAVYLAEEFLESTTDPYYADDVDYGARDEN